MIKTEFKLPESIAPYVNCIMIGEDPKADSKTSIPIYPDGYPGIMFQQSVNPFCLMPKQKELSELFLYGQTIEPSTLETTGEFSYVVVQLYPFAAKYLLGVEPKELNGDCFDLLTLKHINTALYVNKLQSTKNLERRMEVISNLILELVQSTNALRHNQIEQAIALIIKEKGQIKVADVLQKIHMTERTFERNFLKLTGLKPKQFARIIQFQSSLNRLDKNNFESLVTLGMDSGFADQSHFIRTFKKYTGQTPSYYLKQA